MAQMAKKNEAVGMANTDPHALAALAPRTFLRRTFTALANAAQKDSMAYRAVLEALK